MDHFAHCFLKMQDKDYVMLFKVNLMHYKGKRKLTTGIFKHTLGRRPDSQP